MVDAGQPQGNIEPLVNLAKALNLQSLDDDDDTSDSNNNSDDDSDADQITWRQQMEDSIPIVEAIRTKPPAEPRPSQENTKAHGHEIQWIEDIKCTAHNNLASTTTHKIATLIGTEYSPQWPK